MRNAYLVFLCLALSFSHLVKSQEPDKIHCGSDQLDQFHSKNTRGYLERRAQIEEDLKLYGENGKSSSVITIPVVFHLIYRLPEQNISDEQIKSQIDVLNKDYNKKNWDTMFVPPVWKSLIADCQIEFVLANRDPQGNKHSGITRTQTSTSNFAINGDDAYCLASKGGHDIWDRDSYLNIWVCEVDQSLYGFASYPGAPSYCDGVVIAFRSFGTIGTAVSPTDEGRTGTHEVGHWLNLKHPWGNTTCGDDDVNDTPIQQKGNFDCPSFPHVTCNNGPNGDMFMNFMDWTDDDCMHLFTLGQRMRMLATLNSARSSLFASKGYNGVNDQSMMADIRIYPNPATDALYIDIPKNEQVESVELITTSGSVLKYWGNSDQISTQALDLSTIKSGMYLLRIQTSQSSSVHKILIKAPR